MSQKRNGTVLASTANGAKAAAAHATRDLATLPPALTVQQVAEFLQVSTQAVYDLTRQKQLQSFKIGAAIRIQRKSLAVFCGLDDADITSAQEKRREEVECLLARFRVAADECSRVTARLLELGVALVEQTPKPNW